MGVRPKGKPDRQRNEDSKVEVTEIGRNSEEWQTENTMTGGERKKMNDHNIPLSSILFQCCTDLVNFGFHLALFIQPSWGMPSRTVIQWLINAGLPLHNLSPSLSPSLLPSFILSYGASKFWVIPTMQYISMSHDGNHISLFKCNIKIE